MGKIKEKQEKLTPGPGILMGGLLGNDIWVDNNYIRSIVGNSGGVISKQNIHTNAGLIANTYGDDIHISIDEYYIDDKIDRRIKDVNKTKPIFIFGLPNYYDEETMIKAKDMLELKLPDYHVLTLKNKTDDVSAKIFSVEGITSLGIDEIKKYIDFKTK